MVPEASLASSRLLIGGRAVLGAEAIALVFHNRNDSGPAFRCWNRNVASFRCSLVAISVQVLTRLARVAVIAIAAISRLQQIINLADISPQQWGIMLVKRLSQNYQH